MQLFLLLLLLFFNSAAHAKELEIPRVVIALYDSHITPMPQQGLAHNLAEMPLNHLGLKLEYADINAPLPSINQRQDVRGVISWFNTETRIADTEGYLVWAGQAINAGKKFVILGNPAFYENSQGQATSINSINFFLRKLGLHTRLEWINQTYKTLLSYPVGGMFLPDRKISGLLPSYVRFAADNTTTSYLTAHTGSAESQLIVTNPHGGYVADGYSHSFHDGKNEEIRQWYINPFRFFEMAFATDSMPKPDTTTLAGRRIFYSHIDGDGWNNYSQIEEYKKDRILSSEVIMERVAKAYPDLPVTVTVIGADIDPAWSGTEESRNVAKEFFALPNVEVGSHTYSHPFSWAFFEDGNWQKEAPYLHLYPEGSWKEARKSSLWKQKKEKSLLPKGYTTPRAYAKEPFDINKEINGSIAVLSSLLPADKKIEVVTWPGDCLPWEGAISLARKAGVGSINGGDSRFDPEYPSYASVAPLGRIVGKEQQVYASSSNENTYTELWNGRFYGFKYLINNNKRTETPIRIKPLNIYYHIYSGEKQAGLNAVLENLDYARTQDIIPIATRHFIDAAQGFYSTRFIPVGEEGWRILGRGALDTIRFDHATLQAVDFAKSTGVIGQRHFQGSLYVYLDNANEKPIIILKKISQIAKEPEAVMPYLIESRWQVRSLARTQQAFSFTASGFGDGEMRWYVPEKGRYLVNIDGRESVVTVGDNSVLSLMLKQTGERPVKVIVERKDA